MGRRIRKPDCNKTVRQWALLGRTPKEGAEPCYVWTDWYDNPTTYYYTEKDTREMTEAEKAAFEQSERLKKERRYGHRLQCGPGCK